MGKRSARQHQRDQQITAALQNTATRPGRLQRIARGISDDWKKPQRPASASAPALSPTPWQHVSRTWADVMMWHGLMLTTTTANTSAPTNVWSAASTASRYRDAWFRISRDDQKLPKRSAEAPPDPPPLYTEAIIGYRSWIIDVYHQLQPLHRGGPWEPGINTSVCDRHDPNRRGHVAPVHDCECGLYTYLDPHRARDYGRERVSAYHGYSTLSGRQHPMFVATGAVASWGRIEVHRKGTRAQYAQILALEIPERAEDRDADLIRTVAARYRVPAVPQGTLELEAARYGQTLPETALPEPTLADELNATPRGQNYARGGGVTYMNANASIPAGTGQIVQQQVGTQHYRWTQPNGSVWETMDGGVNWTQIV